MPERVPTTDAAPAAHGRRRAATPRASAAEVRAVVDRAARIADGFVLLERAPFECVAVLLGVDPRTVERVRAALEDAGVREAAVRRYADAAGWRRATAAPPARTPAPRDAEALLAEAGRRAGGLSLLLSAAPEAAAIAYVVHPDLVHAARALAASRGLAEEPGSTG